MLLCYIDSITKILERMKKASSAKKIPLAGDPTDFNFRVLNLENMLYEKFIGYSFVLKDEL